MENGDDLDSLAEKIARKRISKKRAAMKVMEIVYTNPGRFNLLDMDEDERSDFLLNSIEKFERIIERHDRSQGPLGAYIYYSIPGMRLSWKRRLGEESAARRSARTCIRRLYEDTAEKSALAVACPPARKYGCNEGGVSGKGGEPLVFRRIFKRRENLLEPKERFYKKRAALLLALKSAWYIDDKSVGRVSEYCGLAEDSVVKAVDKIKKGLLERSERRAELEGRRDRAWYFVCKHRARLVQLDPESEQFRITKRRLEYQLKSWKNKTDVLQSRRMALAPRNKDLAKLFKVKPNRISLYLNYARRLAESGECLLKADSDDAEK